MHSFVILLLQTGSLKDFPTLHPLVVHFALSLLIFSALLQFINIYFLKKEIAWIILAMVFTGLAAAQLASGKFHPDTIGLSETVHELLEQHQKWAEWTIYSSAASLIIQLAYLYFVRYGKRLENNPFHGLRFTPGDRILVFLIGVVMLASAYCVARTGDSGARLVHIEGVGPQGKFLVTEQDIR